MKDTSAAGQGGARVLASRTIEPSNSASNEVAALESQLDGLDTQASSEQLRHSFAGRMGHLIEPTIAPLGFDWKMGIGIIASFAAREVFVSTMATVYSVEQTENEESSRKSLVETLQRQERPDGTPVYTMLTRLTLM